ncbi:methionine synthase [Arthrobacter ginkgonis]|uniref:Methionine synthase n=1 Tax=Arthrobacter ginkgonis TaxID=1630594 RepID=A0ABP7CBJ8_9MICC
MPGVDPIEPVRIVRGELGEPNLPHLVELPGRGVGSDAVGRTAGMLEDLYVDVQSFGWRLVDRPGLDHRRAVSALSTDLGVQADVIGTEERPGDALKIQLRGPFSLAANLHLHNGERALIDHGARRDLVHSLASGAARHVADVLRTSGRPHVTVVVEEPELADVLAGTIPTVSGYRSLRSVPRHEAVRAWSEVVEALRGAGATTVVLAPGVGPVGVPEVCDDVASAGADGVYLPVTALDTRGWERSAGLVEGGLELWLGLLDPGKTPPGVVKAVERVLRPWRQLGLGDASLGALTLLPTTGFAETSPEALRKVLTTLSQTVDALNQVLAEA